MQFVCTPYPWLPKVDPPDKLPHYHDIHTLNNVPLQAGGVRELRQDHCRAKIGEGPQALSELKKAALWPIG